MNNNNLIIIPCVAPENERRNGIIYCIYHNTNQGMFYIGSTFKTLRDRLNKHISDSKRSYKTSKFYQYVNQFSWEQFSAFVYEEMRYVTDVELRIREGLYAKFYNSPLNSCIAGNNYNEDGQLLTNQEYREKTKEHKTAQQKEYRERTKEHITEHKHEYYETNKDI